MQTFWQQQSLNNNVQDQPVYTSVATYTPLYQLHSGQHDYKQLQEALVRCRFKYDAQS